MPEVLSTSKYQGFLRPALSLFRDKQARILQFFLLFHWIFFLAQIPFSSYSKYGESSSKKILKVIIDPGHGGRDRGASAQGIEEADLVLKVGRYLFQILKKDKNFHPILTRSRDRFLSLNERVQLTIRKKGDLLISLHANTSRDKKRKGGEIYFQNHFPPEEESMFLAQMENQGMEHQHELWKLEDSSIKDTPDILSVLMDLKRSHKILLSAALAKSLAQKEIKPSNTEDSPHFRSIFQAPFYVISRVNIPAVLVELGFITHEKESQRLQTSSFQKQLAHQIYIGLIKFKESMDSLLPLT